MQEDVKEQLLRLFEESFMYSLYKLLQDPESKVVEWDINDSDPHVWIITDLEEFKKTSPSYWPNFPTFMKEIKIYGFSYDDKTNKLNPSVKHPILGLHSEKDDWFKEWMNEKISNFMSGHTVLHRFWTMLKSSHLNHIAHWDNQGNVIIVENPAAFENIIGLNTIHRKGFWIRRKGLKRFIYHPCINGESGAKEWIIPECTVLKSRPSEKYQNQKQVKTVSLSSDDCFGSAPTEKLSEDLSEIVSNKNQDKTQIQNNFGLQPIEIIEID